MHLQDVTEQRFSEANCAPAEGLPKDSSCTTPSLNSFKLFKENRMTVDVKKFRKKNQQSEVIFALKVCRKGLDSFLQRWQALIQLWQ